MHDAPPSLEELIGDIDPADQWEIVEEFGGKSLGENRQRLNEIDCNWILEPFGWLQGSGFIYYFPVFEEYARSPDSDHDAIFPGQFAMAAELQLMYRPEQAFKIKSEIRRACDFIMSNLRKFFDGNADWAASTSDIYKSIFERLDTRENEENGKQDVTPNA